MLPIVFFSFCYCHCYNGVVLNRIPIVSENLPMKKKISFLYKEQCIPICDEQNEKLNNSINCSLNVFWVCYFWAFKIFIFTKKRIKFNSAWNKIYIWLQKYIEFHNNNTKQMYINIRDCVTKRRWLQHFSLCIFSTMKWMSFGTHWK